MPASYREPRFLTEQQLKNPLLRQAHKRLGSITTLRGKYLRQLDRVNGDRRTRIEKFEALERAEEQLLVRLDLATSTLGFLDDKNGRYVLNTQRHIAEDSKGLSEAVLSRLLGTLEQAGYVTRRIEKIRLDEKDPNGLHLVRTRVLVQFTMRFWADLGLRYVFERVQRAAMRKRVAKLREIGQRKLAMVERHSLEQMKRQESRKKWAAKEERERKAENPAGGTATTGGATTPAPAARLVVPTKVSGDDAYGALARFAASRAKKQANSS